MQAAASDMRDWRRGGTNEAQPVRLLSLWVIPEGGSRAEAAHLGAPRKKANGAALVLPHCNTEAMSLHLAEITTKVSPGRHDVLRPYKPGRHRSSDVGPLAKFTLLPLPGISLEHKCKHNAGQLWPKFVPAQL